MRLLVLGLVVAGACYAGRMAEWDGLCFVLKPLPPLIMVAWLWPLAGRYPRRIAAGLVLSALGDLFLETGWRLFVPGLVAFLLAHLCYIAAYVGRVRAPQLGRLVPAAAFGVAVFAWLSPSLGAMRGPVLAYVVVICAMLWRAAAQVGAHPQDAARARLALLGALMFVASDVMVAYRRFIDPEVHFEFSLMVLYWGGQWGIAASSERLR